MHYLCFSFCIRPSVPAALRLLGSHSVGVVVLGRHCCCRFKGGSEGGREGWGGREGGGGGALHGGVGVRRHIHPDRHRLSVCRHPSYSTTQWKPAAAHAARRPNAPLRDAGPKRDAPGRRHGPGGQGGQAEGRAPGRVGQQEARKTRSGSGAGRWKAQLQNETNCAPASCRRRRRRRRLPESLCPHTTSSTASTRTTQR